MVPVCILLLNCATHKGITDVKDYFIKANLRILCPLLFSSYSQIYFY